MYKIIDGRLVHLTDDARIKFRTSISKKILEELEQLSEEHDTYANYLIEDGLQRVLKENVIAYPKDSRPKDRVQYQTSYDKELLENIRQFAKEHKLYINDVIEYSVRLIKPESAKKKSYRTRVK